uniref:Crotonobetainyl-CoA-hydratase, putative n=1 Tax=Riptortus pedestris TaxID=329032 RepID=R4WJJ3_RIPPE|nr:crotonobetainyl-CoA-hydratase, putative [Riptortus pedestris]
MSETEVIVLYEGPLQIIKFNRPAKKNALSLKAYSIIRNALKSAADNDQIKITLVTGVGDYFSSGNDFSSGAPVVDEDTEMVVRSAIGHVREFIRALIDYPKILIALVNGPAIGIAVTMLGLFDLVYALKTATFQTPFTSIGISAEGCSTYTFPRSLGKSLAAKMLYFNYKMDSNEAKACGFVADIITEANVPEFINGLKRLAQLPLKSLIYTKQMVRSHDVKSLHYANTVEMENLVELFQSEEFLTALLNNATKKKNKL